MSLQEFLESYGLKLNHYFDYDEHGYISKKNTKSISYNLPCGCEKQVKISSLSNKTTFDPLLCKTCKRADKNKEIDYEQCRFSCTVCNIFYRIPKNKITKNALVKKCYNCKDLALKEEKRKPEDEFYRHFYNTFNIYKNFEYPVEKEKKYEKATKSDYYITDKDENPLLIIEIDSPDHNSTQGKKDHEYKDCLATEMQVKVLRIHAQTLDSFIEEGEATIQAILEDEIIKIHYYKGGSYEEKIFAKSFYDQFSKTKE